MTARNYDSNGWFEIPANPISRSGIFQYLGREISNKLDPDRVYNVYRPESELNNPETINSFKLIPWIPHHEMLGAAGSPADAVGVQGTTGERVEFRNGTLFANIKLYGERLRQMIEDGIRELSVGFRCVYEIVSGTTPDGQPYDVIQKNIVGNHLAIVPAGRAGQEVAVMDHAVFAFDSDRITHDTPTKEGADAMNLDAILAKIEELSEVAAQIEQLKAAVAELGQAKPDTEETPAEPAAESAAEEMDAEETPAEAETDEPTADEAGEGEAPAKAETDGDYSAMDARITALDAKIDAILERLAPAGGEKAKGAPAMDEAAIIEKVNRKNQLAGEVEKLVGTFDHSKMNEQQVAQYAVEKIGVACDSGEEIAALKGYLKAQKTASFTVDNGTGQDSAKAAESLKSKLNAHLGG
jgi:uncharacterized protein